MPPRRPLLLLFVAFVMALAVPAGAIADDDDDKGHSHSGAEPVGAVADPPAYETAAPEAVEALRDDREVAPGVVLTTFDTYDRGGFMKNSVLSASMDERSISSKLLGKRVSGGKALTKHADEAGSIGAVNGDFFNINETFAATGPEVAGGIFRKGISQPDSVFGMGTDRMARLAEVFLEGAVKLPSGERDLGSLNSSTLAAGKIGVYTPDWGPASRTFVQTGSSPVAEVEVREGKVTAVRDRATGEAVPDDGFVLLARDASAEALAGLDEGDEVSFSYRPRSSVPTDFDWALAGGSVLIRGGVVQTLGGGSHNESLHPRTAIGWKDDGRRLLLATVDGRSSSSRGATIPELAQLMKRLGADEAMELDGGGSTEMVARLPGDDRTSVINSPSDLAERPVPNGPGLFTTPGSGELRGFDVRTRSPRVFPGQTRSFSAEGLDETYAGADEGSATERWSASPSSLGRFDPASGTFRARKSGTGEARVQARPAGGSDDDDEEGEAPRGERELTVLDDLVDLSVKPGTLSLEPGDARTVSLVGEDAEGFAAPVEPADAKLSFDPDVVSVTSEPDGSLRVEGLAEADGKGTLVKATVGDVEATLAVTVGLKGEVMSEFEDPARWASSSARGTASTGVVGAPDRPGAAAENRALRLTYDFRGQPSTSAAYANARPTALTLPAGTQRLSMWVKGDGQKHWLRATMRSRGTTNVPFTFALSVDWTGWRRVEGVIPTGFAEPVTLSQVYLVETSLTRKNNGEVLFDDLTARVGQSLDVPLDKDADPFVVQQGEAGREDRWNFAALSDTHTTAAAGKNSFSGRQTIAALKQVAASKPDFVLLNGDAVDTNRPEDFAFFKSLLAEHLPADLPVRWTPGNHESGSSSGGSLDNFRAGTDRPTRETFDHEGTRFILMNSHLGSLRLSEWEEVRELKAQLDEAARDRSVEGVVVAFHHPLTDPSGGGASQLSDSLEAQLVRRWLADFREDSGKNAGVFNGHAHTAAIERTDGVLEVNTPAVGKTPYARPDAGGFFGWMSVGVDEDPERLRAGRPDEDSLDWMRAEVRPVIDRAELLAPDSLAVDESQAPVSAEGITSEFGLRFPLEHPASVTWSGSESLAVVRGERQAAQARRSRRTTAVLDLETMRLDGVRPGSVTLSLASGGVRVEREVRVEEAAAAAG